jgi:hypothetical protein
MMLFIFGTTFPLKGSLYEIQNFTSRCSNHVSVLIMSETILLHQKYKKINMIIIYCWIYMYMYIQCTIENLYLIHLANTDYILQIGWLLINHKSLFLIIQLITK